MTYLRYWSSVVSGLLAIVGLMVLCVPFVHLGHAPEGMLLHSVPPRQQFIVAPLLGISFLYLAITLKRGYRFILYIISGLLVGTLMVSAANILLEHAFYGLVLFGAVLVTLIAMMPLYSGPVVRSALPKDMYEVLGFVAVFLLALTYGVIGFLLLGPRFFNDMHPTVWQGLSKTFSAWLLPDEFVSAPSRVARMFIASLDGVGMAVIATFVLTLVRPVQLAQLFNRPQRHQLQRLFEQYPVGVDDYFKLWPQPKRYFFSLSQQSCITYASVRRYIFVLGNPNGDPAEFAELIQQFTQYCRTHGWMIAVIMPSKKIAGLYHRYIPTTTLTIGSEAIVDIADFVKTTARNKHFRYVVNRAAREELAVEEVDTAAPGALEKLRAISNKWLTKDRREYAFFMGYFDAHYLHRSRVFVLRQGERWIAYCTLIPTWQKRAASIDQLRSVNDVPPVGMHFLLTSILRQLNNEGVTHCNLGLAPLSDLSGGLNKRQQIILPLMKRLGNRYYSFAGVEQFKNKFQPEWKPAILAYTGSSLYLTDMLSELTMVSSYSRTKNYVVPAVSVSLLALVVTLIVFLVSE